VTSPPKPRKWTKRDHKAWLDAKPIMLCEPYRAAFGWLWKFWCCHCRAYHAHGPAPGLRSSHCTNPESPLKHSDYILKLDPRFKDLNDLCQIETREMWARLRRRVTGDEQSPATDAMKG
jgi:hypothetical protein